MTLLKTLTMISLLTLPALAPAKTKTVLFCKDIDQSDLKSITIQQNSDIKQEGLLELIEIHTDGSKTQTQTLQQDVEDGWVPVSPRAGVQRILVQKEGKWTVAENKGDYRVFNSADCVK